jgi:hypothetical protein
MAFRIPEFDTSIWACDSRALVLGTNALERTTVVNFLKDSHGVVDPLLITRAKTSIAASIYKTDNIKFEWDFPKLDISGVDGLLIDGYTIRPQDAFDYMDILSSSTIEIPIFYSSSSFMTISDVERRSYDHIVLCSGLSDEELEELFDEYCNHSVLFLDEFIEIVRFHTKDELRWAQVTPTLTVDAHQPVSVSATMDISPNASISAAHLSPTTDPVTGFGLVILPGTSNIDETMINLDSVPIVVTHQDDSEDNSDDNSEDSSLDE